jgi:hypothetical protein
VSVHKVPFAVLRSSPKYSFTMSKLRISDYAGLVNNTFGTDTHIVKILRVHGQALITGYRTAENNTLHNRRR